MFMLTGIIILLGTVSLLGLPLDLLPELNLPIAVATADFPGAAPTEVEELLTRPLEEALTTVPRVEHISSYSRAGSTTIIMQFDWGTAMDFALLDARERLDLVQPFLPSEASSPRLIQADPNLFPVMQVMIHGDADSVDLRRAALETVKPRLERVAGVAVADVLGGAREEVHVTAHPLDLLPYGLTLAHLEQALLAGSLDLAAGPLREEKRERIVRTEGKLVGVDEIRALPLLPFPTGVLTLGAAASVELVQVETGGISRYNGKPSVTIAITKQSGANTVAVANAIRKTLQQLAGELPPGMALQVVSDQSAFIRESLRNVLEVGLTGGILASLILLLFLKSPLATLVVLLAIPVSIVATFVLMFFGGITINIISLGGLALGLGIMLDNSIVVLENIFRLHQEGLDPVEAAKQGGSEVAGALLAATLTTVVVFLPVLFLQGIVAQIFNPLALTVSFALLASLLVALTLVPLFASRLLSSPSPRPPAAGGGRKEGVFMGFSFLYQQALTRVLQAPLPLLLLVSALLGLSLFLWPHIGSEFLPPIDEGIVNISMELPPTTPLQVTMARAAALEERLLALEGVESVKTAIGTGTSLGPEGFGSVGPHQARLEALLVPLKQRSQTSRDLADTIRDLLAVEEGASFRVEESRQASGGGFMETPVSISLRGRDLQVLEELSAKMVELVQGVPGTREVSGSFQQRRPEILATVRRETALRRGVSPLEVAGFLRTVLQGRQVGRIFTAQGERPVFFKVDPAAINSLADLQSLPFLTVSPPSPFTAASPSAVPLGELVEFKEAAGPLAIRRANQMRAAYIEAQVSHRDVGSVTGDIQRELANLDLPAGYTLSFEGEQSLMEESFADLQRALILSLFLVYMIMAAQFESLRQPLVIMFTMPLTLMGILGGLFLSGRPLSVPAYIGIIMLGGIVVNNAIVMLDHVNRLRQGGTELLAAILAGTRVRLRPILMTSLTTLLAMLPLALGLGSGAEIQAPLAVVVGGGLLTSTLLTLFVVPAVYYLLEKRNTI